MSIITLTTDLGQRDHYTAALKGSILARFPEAILVDITHQISAFNILEAAYVLKSAYPKFPEGTVHLIGVDPGGGKLWADATLVYSRLIGVDPGGGKQQKGLAASFEGQYFVAPDNGVLSLIRGRKEALCFEINHPEILPSNASHSFASLGIYAPAAAWLAAGKPLKQIGEPFEMREIFWGEPSSTESSLRGVIIHVDHFGNAITNITRDEFMRVKGQRSFELHIRNLKLQRIVSTYSDVARGEALAIFSDSGHLEIALREGSAEKLLGLEVQNMLTIEFRN